MSKGKLSATMSEAEVGRIASETISSVMSRIPYNGQDENERRFAEHFILKELAKLINPRLDKIEKTIKADYADGLEGGEQQAGHYRLTASVGTPRETFDKDAFLRAVAVKYNLSKAELDELARETTKISKPPVSISLSYLEDPNA